MDTPDLPCPLCNGSGMFDSAEVFAKAWKRTTVEEGTGCWTITKASATTRYPSILHKRHRVDLHRFALSMTMGRWPKEHALHTCDNVRCWNPAHLYEGDAFQNNQDRRQRALTYGRAGEANPFARLTWARVEEIRAAGDHRGMLTRARAKAFSEQFGVSMNSIYRVYTGKSWRRDTRVVSPPTPHWQTRQPPAGPTTTHEGAA